MYRNEWLEKAEQVTALLLTSESDAACIDGTTVERFGQQMRESHEFARAAFPRLQVTRAALEHPFDASFIHRVLAAMPNAQRDLVWSEWIRSNSRAIEQDAEVLAARWNSGALNEREIKRARWAMWTLTSTSRRLRDLFTKSLYEFAVKRAASFFDLAVESISISDPYVPERMFAAAYGAALSTWSDPNCQEMRGALPRLARTLIQLMFEPGAAYPNWHALYRQYCLGLIALARMVEPACVSDEVAAFLVPPFEHLPSPFEDMPSFDQATLDYAARSAIRMDFGNYTLGRLIPYRRGRSAESQERAELRTAIVARMLTLGYDLARFDAIDREMSSDRRMGAENSKVDRYGKKYAWIAYFEMWGVRHARGLLTDELSLRPSDTDIDPSFPQEVRHLELTLPDLFSNQPVGMGDWVANGPQPDYLSIFELPEIEGKAGPWVVLDGFLEQNSPTDDRQVFTFLRGVLVDNEDVDGVLEVFDELEYPGNSAIPDEPETHNTYAGELPFETTPGMGVSSEQDEESDVLVITSDHTSSDGVEVDLPVQRYSWDSAHSAVNKASGVVVPSARLCAALGLQYRGNDWDFCDVQGTASISRSVGERGEDERGHFCYLRRDLLDRYLLSEGKSLVWLMWGERGVHYRAADSHNLQEYHANHQHIHKRSQVHRLAAEAPDRSEAES